MNDGQRRIIRAWLDAPDKTVTASYLAKTAGYKTHGGACQSYGRLASSVCDYLNVHRDIRVDILARCHRVATSDKVQLTLHPAVVSALSNLGWSRVDPPRFFTTYWQAASVEQRNSQFFDGTGGNEYRKKGVCPNDLLYLFTIKDGTAFFVARMKVGSVVNRPQAVAQFGRHLWRASDWCIAAAGTATKLIYDRPVPTEIAKRLRFKTEQGESKLAFSKRDPGKLNGQTLRSVRELTPQSAHLLDTLLGTSSPPAMTQDETLPDVFTEGATRQVLADVYERDALARRSCIEHHGCKCSVCGFDFEATYGVLGCGFIHVHHLRPLSEIRTEHSVDPIGDLRPVCPNCHAMLHMQEPPMAPEALKAAIAKQKKASP